jgi:hypothetical protein
MHAFTPSGAIENEFVFIHPLRIVIVSPATRRRLIIGAPLVVALLIGVAFSLAVRGGDLRTRAAQISVGMTRPQVEAILGPPILVLKRTNNRGHLLSWVDQLWQVDVLMDTDGLVESVGHMPSNSAYRQAEKWLGKLFK